MKNHVILTASDKKYGDFLIDHWYKSLKENVDLTDINLAVADYGLTTAQRFYLTHHDVLIYPGKRDGHVAVIRFRDFHDFLSLHSYDQVLICDSGDIIFQDNIFPLFNEDKTEFRAVCEENKTVFSFFLRDEFFSREDMKKIGQSFLNNKMVNAGFILGPSVKMQYLCRQCNDRIKNKEKFGPDQLLINLILYETGFKELDSKYNYVILTGRGEIFIKDGTFYFADGDKIPVIHNAGNFKLIRPVEKFGYGKEYNILKEPLYTTLKYMINTSNNVYNFRNEILHSRLKFKDFFLRMQKPGK